MYYSTFRDKQLMRVSWNVKNKMSFLGGAMENAMDGGAWWAAVHGVAKSWTRLSDFTFTFHFHALEKKMATHSSVLAWRIPGTGEPGGLPSLGSHRVGHDWSDLAAAAADTVKCLLALRFHGIKFQFICLCLTLNSPRYQKLPGQVIKSHVKFFPKHRWRDSKFGLFFAITNKQSEERRKQPLQHCQGSNTLISSSLCLSSLQ